MLVIGQVDTLIETYKDLLLKLLVSPKLPFDKNLRSTLPNIGGIYRISEYGTDWYQSVYLGKTGNLQRRVYEDLLMGNLPRHTLKRKTIEVGLFIDKAAVKQYFREKCVVQILEIADNDERTRFEHFAIAILKPSFND